MATKTMTMHQVLAELKTLDTRIEKGLKVSLVGNYQGELAKVKSEVEASEKQIISGYDSVKHLIENKKALEAVRAHSNEVTKVVIGGKEYTVAEAIKRKHDIKYDKMLLAQMVSQYETLTKTIKNRNELVARDKQNYAVKAFEASKVDGEVIDLQTKLAKIAELEEKFVRENSYTIIDPLKLQDKIEALDKEITAFEIEVDAALSVSNAVTSVEVELMD